VGRALLQGLLCRGVLLDRLIQRAERRDRLRTLLFDTIAGLVPKTALLSPHGLAQTLL
jgi:hypothetical protein